MVAASKRRIARRAERGTAVVIVVMVTTLITAIGLFAVRNISQVDQAVGFSRQSAQTNALAELGTSAAMSQVVVLGAFYTGEMDKNYPCLANGAYISTLGSTCYRMKQSEIEGTTTSNSGETLLEPAVAGSESGSFGPLARTAGFVSTELTEKYKTNGTTPGTKQGSASTFDVTMTTTANVRPITTNADPCGDSVPTVTVKKVLRAHTIVPGPPEGS